MVQTATTEETLRAFFSDEVLTRVTYKDWKFGVRDLPVTFGGNVTFPWVEKQLVIYIPYPSQERLPEEYRQYYQFRYMLADAFLDEVFDALKWMFECCIMRVERAFAEASFVYGSDYLMLDDESIEIVRWEVVQRFARN